MWIDNFHNKTSCVVIRPQDTLSSLNVRVKRLQSPYDGEKFSLGSYLVLPARNESFGPVYDGDR